MSRRVYLKKIERKNGEFQFFMHQFVESGEKCGVKIVKEYRESFCYKVLRRICKYFPCVYKNKKAVIVASSGANLYYSSFPYLNYEVIPMLWDVWPTSWAVLFRDLKRLKCKIVFVTVRQMAEKIEKELGIKAYWIPEGIDINDYNKGKQLKDRTIQVYEMGRQHPAYHNILCKLIDNHVIMSYKGNTYYDEAKVQTKTLAFDTAEDLLNALGNIQIITCFPQCDTHPDRAQNLETLTQRYWEAMLSRCLILGRAPQELIDLIGYNPLIEIDWNNSEKQLTNILSNIEKYQNLVDKNYATALQFASWKNRWKLIIDTLHKDSYVFD